MKRRAIHIAWITGAVIAAGYLLWGLKSTDKKDGFHLDALGRISVQSDGRIKPLDSLARVSLLLIHERQSYRAEERKWTAIEWLAEVIFTPDRAAARPFITIHHPDLVALLAPAGEQERKNFSLSELFPNLQKLNEQAQQASRVEAQLRTAYQREVIEVSNALSLLSQLQSLIQLPEITHPAQFFRSASREMVAGRQAFEQHQQGKKYDQAAFDKFLGIAGLFRRLDNPDGPRLIPPTRADQDPLADWWTLGSASLKVPAGSVDPAVLAYAEMAEAYRAGDPKAFNQSLDDLESVLEQRSAKKSSRAALEANFNHAEVFYRSSVLYVLVFLLVVLSWIKWPNTLNAAAVSILLVTLIAHTIGLGIRMYLHGRPPVTNLYSSAVFVGWGAVLLGLVLERFFKNGIGSASAATIGFLSLIVAHHLAEQGDTLAMLQAVLDTNFWLATHVVIITLGYAATFLAGFLAIVYILRGFFTGSLDPDTEKSLNRMVYGIVCFATLFSLVGTLLGGIWADQSWGRFWGWDPKENGALLIVLWNAIILHARWGGLIRTRGLMILAVLGNIVTAWSWFGTNMLGVGLHSYGFMEEAFFWLATFVFFQLMFAAIGLVPLKYWGSFEKRV
jgi:ABC-type transport system involved in cytochrome c biogenesis permease subunit